MSDDGLVLVEDWGDPSVLSGTLNAFSRSGDLRWSRAFEANIFKSGLSSDGRRAFVSTCHSDYEPHSGKTFMVDVDTGEVLWTREGWGDVRFEGNELGAELNQSAGGRSFFPFDAKGQLPEAYWEAADELRSSKYPGFDHWAVLLKARAAMKKVPPDVSSARLLLADLDGLEADITDRSCALLHRLRGEIAEIDGDFPAALAYWQEALALDSQVGIKRRYEALLSKVES